MINIDNFTVTVVSFPEFVGVDWSLDNPTAILRLTPNQGFEINAINFQATSPLPTYVASVAFVQDGSDILCTITYNQPSIMPAQDVFINICASGFSRPTNNITVNGNILYAVSGIVNGINPSFYNGQGGFGETNTVANIAIVASAGKFFPNQPTVALSVGELANYTFTSTNTLNTNGDIIQTNIVVDYTYPVNNVNGDVISVFAKAEDLYNPPIEIQGYVFDTSPVSVGGVVRPLQVIGIEGAAYNIQMTNSVGLQPTWSPISGVLDNTGQANLSISIPATTANETYTFQISGDLASTFCTVAPYSPCATGQPAVWDVLQIIDQDVSFVLNSTDPNITVGAADTNTFTYGTGPGITYYSVSATSTQDFIWDTVPVAGDFDNQGLSLPNTQQQVQSPINITIDNASNPKKLDINLNSDIQYVGSQPLQSTLNLDNFLSGTYQPIQVFYSATSQSDACCNGVLVNAFIQNGETFANAVAILDSSGNPAADGYYSQ